MTAAHSLKDKVAVITGGSRGVGKAVADALVAAGAKVVIGDLLDKEGQELVQSYNEKSAENEKVAAYLHTDVRKYSDNKALFQLAEKEFGGVDIAILNAGIATNSNSVFTPLDDELEARMFDVNIISVVKGTKVAILHMAKRGGGVIVHTASLAGFYASPSLSSYTASKHAVVGYTRSFQLLPQVCNVRVNAICPYWIETDLLNSLSSREGADPMEGLIAVSPRVPIDTVVEGFLTLITDETRNAQTLMALPDGLQVQDPLPPKDSLFTAENLAHSPIYLAEAVADFKKKLAKAMEEYGI
ncbi:uncharacterized protein BYT42DRAFT_551652 [Radiomyces spectabilis]|uniref:uncharacterized protein n=1 Tax=Radiomyces spectabilis TaxID=64574 RepID=UPI00221FF52F|nr:uncharacterized protein BYT42DRAFT_551652 [Radiomyces spectabilis]KAI8393611.1 hypothetical protein BYT42DRAFT_551652 [Radiomyces spectabilis]